MREQSSGARSLLERELRGVGAAGSRTLSGAVVTSGHGEIPQADAKGAANTAVATRDATITFGLPFIPLVGERHDSRASFSS